MQAKRKRKGTAAKSLTLTYAQLEFLGGLDNASAWVRGAIDEALEIRRGEKVVVELKDDIPSKIIRIGLDWWELDKFAPWQVVIREMLKVMDAHREAIARDKATGDRGEDTFNKFVMPGYAVSRSLSEMLEDGRESRL